MPQVDKITFILQISWLIFFLSSVYLIFTRVFSSNIVINLRTKLLALIEETVRMLRHEKTGSQNTDVQEFYITKTQDVLFLQRPLQIFFWSTFKKNHGLIYVNNKLRGTLRDEHKRDSSFYSYSFTRV